MKPNLSDKKFIFNLLKKKTNHSNFEIKQNNIIFINFIFILFLILCILFLVFRYIEKKKSLNDENTIE